MNVEPVYDIVTAKARINHLWSDFLAYAASVQQNSDKYWKLVDSASGTQAVEQLKGFEDWVVRTKGSYESKLWEMEILINHIDSEGSAIGYLGYDTHEHPDVSVVNTKSKTAVAIEMKQVESSLAAQVNVNIYSALDQLLKREQFDSGTKFTSWKAYIYVNADNPWPWTKMADDGKDYKTLVLEKAADHANSNHWKNWTKLGKGYKVKVAVRHAVHGRVDYELQT